MGKTDLEIAVDAIKYCRSKLAMYILLLLGITKKL